MDFQNLANRKIIEMKGANIEERLEILFDPARDGHGRTLSSMMCAT